MHREEPLEQYAILEMDPVLRNPLSPGEGFFEDPRTHPGSGSGAHIWGQCLGPFFSLRCFTPKIVEPRPLQRARLPLPPGGGDHPLGH